MEKKRSVGAIVILLSFCLLSPVFAETIILKSGGKVEAKIIKRTDEYVTIDYNGTPVTYHMYEIESINEENSILPSTDKEKLSQDNTSSYSDKDIKSYSEAEFDKELLNFGIRFIPPQGWQKIKPPNAPSAAVYYIQPDKKANIVIPFPFEGNKQVSFKLALVMLRIAKKPISEEKITFCGVPCYIFIIHHTNKAGMTIKTKNYQFFKNGKVYNIDYTSDASGFCYYLPEFEKALDTFELLK